LDGRADLAVHSLKDLPAQMPKELIVSEYPKAESPLDVLIVRDDLISSSITNPLEILKALPQGCRVGTSSLRRQYQIQIYRKGLHFVPLRGNIGTRLEKLLGANPVCDVAILAQAGLNRLPDDRNAKGLRLIPFEKQDILPALGQGILGLQRRRGDSDMQALMESIADPATTARAQCERSFLRKLGGDCRTPVGGFADVSKNVISFQAWLSHPQGQIHMAHHIQGDVEQSSELGSQLAQTFLDQGAQNWLDLYIP